MIKKLKKINKIDEFNQLRQLYIKNLSKRVCILSLFQA